MRWKLVLDTNVWLDWLVFDDPGVAPIRNAARVGSALIYIDNACLLELERVLAYPLRNPPLCHDTRAGLLAEAARIACSFERDAETAGESLRLPACRDADDQKFLELARDCAADALITKDRALLDLARSRSRRLTFRILKPEDFMG